MKRRVGVELKADDKSVFLAVDLEEEDIDDIIKNGVRVYDPDRPIGTKKKFAFLIPILAGLPTTTVVVGTATLGIISGAAMVIGGKVADVVWPNKKEPTDVS
jgi:hypothetical protein